MSQIIAKDAFKVIEGRPVTSSLKVAEYFGKQHFNVLRDIENLIEKKPELRGLNFEVTQEIKKIGAVERKVPFYWMDRKGFCILAMGFTGAKALEFKCAFYDEFERMEKELHPTLEYTDGERSVNEYMIRKAVQRRAQSEKAHYQHIYHALYDRFRISSYKDLRQDQIREALTFIEVFPLPKRPELPAPAIPEGYEVFPSEIVDRFLTFAYCWRYLYHAPLEEIIRMLRAVRSPLAGIVWDMVNDLNLGMLEDELAKGGRSVKALPCYRHLMGESA